MDSGKKDGQRKLNPPGPGYRLIWRPYITTKNGKKVYASSKGLKAFPIWIKE